MATRMRSSEVLDAYYARVLGVAYQVLGDTALATQAADTCFTQLIRFRRLDAVHIWRVAVEVLHTYLDRGLHVELLAADARGWQATLLDGLSELEPDERMILLLRYHEGLDYEQLATVMDADTMQIRSAIVHARRRLSTILGLADALH